MISIIVPVYKAEKYLRQCIDSILMQSYQDWELLLVDDGSPDSSGAICDEYAALDAANSPVGRTRIRVFHEENGGVSSARNLGLDHAQGEYVTFVDADDSLTKDAYQKCSEALSKEDIDLLQFSYVYGTPEEIQFSCIKETTGLLTNEQVFKKDYFLGSIWCCLFKRSILEEYKIRFHEDLWKAEDAIFQYEYLFRAKTFKHIDYTLYYYRSHEENAMHKPDDSQNLILRTQYKTALAEQWPAVKTRFDQFITLNLLYLIVLGEVSEQEISNLFRQAKIRHYLTYYTLIGYFNPKFAYTVASLAEPHYRNFRRYKTHQKRRLKRFVHRIFKSVF